MRCKTCDYRLWNLTSRICPECGSPFVPSEFEFTPNSVKFLCPHCGQEYYGTTYDGHLDPPSFDCVACGQHIHMDEMLLLPADHVTEEQTTPDQCPWLERQRRGFFKAFFSMIGMSMVHPVRLIRSVPVDSSLATAWGFAALMLLLPFTIGASPVLLLIMFGSPSEAMGFLLFVLGAMVTQLVTLALWGVVIQVILRITGGCNHTIGRTYQALCYSSGAMVLTAIPCIGVYFALAWSIWWMISAVLMIQDTHRVHGGRATLAVLTLPGLGLLTCVGGYAGFIYYVFTGGFGGFPTNQVNAATQTEIQAMTDALLDFEGDHARWPTHAAELMVGEYCNPSDFATAQFNTDYESLPIAGGMLFEYDEADAETRQSMIDEATEDIPEDIIAHRFGDYVFTYHGIDADSGDGELWIVIFSPDPEGSSYAGMGMGAETWIGVIVGKLDGSTETISSVSIQTRFNRQNRLRRDHGLKPLPIPSDIKNDEPWTPDSKRDPMAPTWPQFQLEELEEPDAEALEENNDLPAEKPEEKEEAPPVHSVRP